jgi:hypothetical protein
MASREEMERGDFSSAVRPVVEKLLYGDPEIWKIPHHSTMQRLRTELWGYMLLHGYIWVGEDGIAHPTDKGLIAAGMLDMRDEIHRIIKEEIA